MIVNVELIIIAAVLTTWNCKASVNKLCMSMTSYVDQSLGDSSSFWPRISLQRKVSSVSCLMMVMQNNVICSASNHL